MLNAGLLVLMLQGAAVPAAGPQTNNRLSIGPIAGVTVLGDTDDGGFGITAGAGISVPIAGRFSVDARTGRLFPESEFGFYDVRAKATIGSTRARARWYAAAGTGGFWEIEDRFTGGAPKRELDIRRPDLWSLGLGVDAAVARHVIIPVDATVLWHPDGGVLAMVTFGVHWSLRP